MTQITRTTDRAQYERAMKRLAQDPTQNHHRPVRKKFSNPTTLSKNGENGGGQGLGENDETMNFISGESGQGDKVERVKTPSREQNRERRIPSSDSPKRITAGPISPPSSPSPTPEEEIEGQLWHPSPSAVPEVDALFSSDNPLIALAQSINMSFDPEKVNSGDFGELTDLFIKSAFFNNAAMIQQLPMLFGRSVRLTQFINQIEDDLFDPEKFKYLSANQKTALLAIVDRAQADITKGITRNSATIIQGMEALPKLAAFSEELHKKKVMEIPQDEDGKASAMMKMLKNAIAAKASERKEIGDE